MRELRHGTVLDGCVWKNVSEIQNLHNIAVKILNDVLSVVVHGTGTNGVSWRRLTDVLGIGKESSITPGIRNFVQSGVV